MRRAARVDNNHAAIVRDLTMAGMKAVSTASMGKGFPDLAVGYRGLTCFLEVKDGEKCDSAKQLTADEKAWHESWPGHIAIVESSEAAICAVIDHARQMGRI
jgi:hypothetical protein